MAGLNSKEKLQTRVRVAELSKKKSALLYNFYENIKAGGEVFSTEDIDIALEALNLAQLDITEREARQRQEQEAEQLKQKMDEDEKRRLTRIFVPMFIVILSQKVFCFVWTRWVW